MKRRVSKFVQRIGPLGAADGGNRTSRSSEIGHGQPVSACLPSCVPVLGAPNVVGVPVIVGAPFWMYGHVGVLSAEIDGVEGGVIPLRGVSKLTAGANGLGLSATDGGLRPPPPISVEPSGMPTGPTDEPGPIDEASGTDAVADAAHGPGAVAVMPPPSKSALPDNVVLEFPVAAYAPVVGVPAAVEAPIPADAPVIGLDVMADAGAGEAPAHVAPIKGEAPNVVGLTPGVASSVAPMGIPLCPTGALGMPNGEVIPSGGRGDTFRGACA